MHNAVTRLVRARMKKEDTDELVFWFTNHSNESAMERYVMEHESGQWKSLANG